MKKWTLFCASLLVAALSTQIIHATEYGDVVENANRFIKSLSQEQTAKAVWAFSDQERQNWHIFPKERMGLPLKEMDVQQSHLAHAFLNSILSHSGYAKALTIMSLEQVLHIMENNNPGRDPSMYFFTFFDNPHAENPWGFRIEGHHMSINMTFKDGKAVSSTPLAMGSNPGNILEGPLKGLRALGKEEDLGRELVKSLDEEQRSKAIFTDQAPKEILTGFEVKANPLEKQGIIASEMNAKQTETLFQVIKEYVYRVRPEFAEHDLQQIQKAGPEKIQFAWGGSIEPGEAHYYRIQGPTFVLEYANTQNNANHAHTVWRDFNGDFGFDILKEHYQTEHN